MEKKPLLTDSDAKPRLMPPAVLSDNGGILLVGATLCFVVNLFVQEPALGGVALIVWFAGVVRRTRTWAWLGEDFASRQLYGSLGVGSCFVLLLSAVYLKADLSGAASGAALAIVTAGILLVPQGPPVSLRLERGMDGAAWLALAAAADIFMLALLALVRTDEAIVSPWNFFRGEPFVLFFLATALLMLGNRKRRDDLGWLAGILHAFTALSVSCVVFAVGFGFDPFIHRAAETALTQSGSIEPKQILYSGQYLLVAALSHLTALPLKQIDIWALPVAASLLLPTAVSIGLRDGWYATEQEARTWWPAVLAIPFMLVTFTVPFTWTYAFFLAFLFLLPAAKASAQQITLLAAAAVLALFHPLLAVPTFLFILGWAAFTRAKRAPVKLACLAALAAVTAVSVPAMLAAYQKAQGEMIRFADVFEHLRSFTNLFRSPYYDPYPFIPWHLDALYNFRYWLPMIAIAIALVVMIFMARRTKDEIGKPYLAFALGLLGSIFGASTLFSFKDIIAHEQSEFALRLLQAWYVISLPFLALLFLRLARRRRLAVPLILIMSALVTHAWFFSYPQFNLKFPFLSPSVSRDDVAVVRSIEELASGAPYLVLSNQMTSAAALQEFGFARYYPLDGELVLWYAIPTGGPLYAYYAEAINYGGNRPLIDKLHEKTGVKRVYFVAHDYWPWDGAFLESIQEASDVRIEVNQHATIYEYQYP